MSEDPVESVVPPGDTEPEPMPEAVFVEPLLGVEEFLATPSQFATLTPAVRQAAVAALKRWMRDHGADVDGHYSYAQWQTYFARTMAHS
jgi:hypothetical protein